MGLYYMDEGKGIDMVDLVFLNKVSNIKPIPGKANIKHCSLFISHLIMTQGAQWLSGRVLDWRPRGRRIEPHRRHCVVVLEQDTFILA